MRGTRWLVRLRRHNWTASIIELVIVALGILLALQVSNWNQERLDRARGDRYLQRIHSELVADRQDIDQTIALWRTVSTYGGAAIAHGERGDLVGGSRWKTVLAYYHASQLKTIELEDTTFSEMRDSGDLGLIANEELRKQLANYYRMTGAGTRAMILKHDPEYRPQVRGLTPWHVQEYIWSNCFRQLAGTQQEYLDCPSPISEQQAGLILADYGKADDLLQNLRFWMSTLKVSVIVIGGVRKDTEVLLDDVRAAQKE
ncbi:hypothetical protein J2X02_000631 [Pseudoxanthomonas japonensis]|uniref:hypothetical protein n=1 Tax=Pseudoxanthomonas japonensis TaxID=69284 RepID=UPI00285F17DC|nr:hypothetical protein [Pseudoxanthomonas japonensis]MDR7067814.1 hypothetical protein [Pseudoxanthomonas japonensis]